MDLSRDELLENKGLIRGSVVRSEAGHDRRQVFLVMNVDGCFAWLADGGSRPHEHPKRKRIRHMRPIGVLQDPSALDQVDALGDVGQRNAALRNLLKEYLATQAFEGGK